MKYRQVIEMLKRAADQVQSPAQPAAPQQQQQPAPAPQAQTPSTDQWNATREKAALNTVNNLNSQMWESESLRQIMQRARQRRQKQRPALNYAPEAQPRESPPAFNRLRTTPIESLSPDDRLPKRA